MNTEQFDQYDDRSFMKFSNPAIVEKDLQTLVGIMKGIQCDQSVNDRERAGLMDWVNQHKANEQKQPYKELIENIRQSLADNIITTEESDSIILFCEQYIQKNGYYTLMSAGIQQLHGIIQGIVMDDEINAKEFAYLDTWMEENDYLKNSYPYDELYNLLTSILQDGVISNEEHTELLAFCKMLVSSDEDGSNAAFIKHLKTGFYQIDPSIKIQESSFCITGVSKKFKRRELAERIELYGGFVVDRVTSSLNYLIVCNEKNTCWAFTCYGKKIEEAVKHRKAGKALIIVHEHDFYDALESV